MSKLAHSPVSSQNEVVKCYKKELKLEISRFKRIESMDLLLSHTDWKLIMVEVVEVVEVEMVEGVEVVEVVEVASSITLVLHVELKNP